ncbi:unnamed protein product [Closterium sp. Yama58-4]|nr:unnamed protein product [Closterium sp. Yama58-4]
MRGSSGVKRVGKYELGRTLGEGNFAKVKLGQDVESGRRVAIKVMDKDRILQHRMADQIKREVSIMKMVRHPNIVQLIEVLASRNKIFMVLEFAAGGELFDRIVYRGRLAESEARRYFQQLVDAVDCCHAKGVCHRDLKFRHSLRRLQHLRVLPRILLLALISSHSVRGVACCDVAWHQPENLLVDERGNLKVSDFGLSALPQQQHRDGLLHTTCGTPNYVAPEVLHNKGYDGRKADVWSCGVILFVLLAGYVPFDEPDLVLLYDKVCCSMIRAATLRFEPLLSRLLHAPCPVGRDASLVLHAQQPCLSHQQGSPLSLPSLPPSPLLSHCLFFRPLHQISRAHFKFPEWFSPGVKRLITRILNPDPATVCMPCRLPPCVCRPPPYVCRLPPCVCRLPPYVCRPPSFTPPPYVWCPPSPPPHSCSSCVSPCSLAPDPIRVCYLHAMCHLTATPSPARPHAPTNPSSLPHSPLPSPPLFFLHPLFPAPRSLLPCPCGMAAARAGGDTAGRVVSARLPPRIPAA